jgi:hypothetical protein
LGGMFVGGFLCEGGGGMPDEGGGGMVSAVDADGESRLKKLLPCC